jgi:uncharacterized protein (DUF1499 family)
MSADDQREPTTMQRDPQRRGLAPRRLSHSDLGANRRRVVRLREELAVASLSESP